MRVRVKSRFGTSIVNCANDAIRLSEFIEEIRRNSTEADGRPVVALKVGFPPKPIDMTDLDKPINDLGIKNGDQVILEVEPLSDDKQYTASAQPAEESNKPKSDPNIPSTYITTLDKYLVLRNIPDDNSCMFNAISYGLFGYNSFQPGGISPPRNLRSIVKDTIESHPDKYSEVVLGRPVEKYCQWILKKDSWGGAIELGILADWFKVRINCLDIELGKIIGFENDLHKPEKFMVLIYLGIHYDVLSVNPNLSTQAQDKQNDICVWPLNSNDEDAVIKSSNELCHFLQTQNYSTNTTTFRIRCLDCYKILVGEMGASKHANETGHYNFGEVK